MRRHANLHTTLSAECRSRADERALLIPIYSLYESTLSAVCELLAECLCREYANSCSIERRSGRAMFATNYS